MTNEELQNILLSEQESIVSMLLIKDKIKLIDINGGLTFSNIKFDNFSKISTKDAENYLSLWPEEYRCSKTEAKLLIERLINSYNITLENIYLATKKWLEEKESPYHGSAKNFLLKKDGTIETSRCLETLNIMKNKEAKQRTDFRNRSL